MQTWGMGSVCMGTEYIMQTGDIETWDTWTRYKWIFDVVTAYMETWSVET